MPMLGTLLSETRTRIAPVSTSASLDAQLLMAFVLGVDRAHVIAHPERELTPDQVQHFAALAARRASGEPMAYIFARRAFYDLDLAVSPDVLIPRPETELLVELAIESEQAHRADCVAADIGTGSGAIAVTFATHVPAAAVYAVDLSAAALEVAHRNATLNHVQIQLLHGDLLSPLIENRVTVDLLLANLPYIASGVVPGLEVSRFEPALALDGGPDGLVLIRRLMAAAPLVLRAGALVLLEIGADQGASASDIVRAALPSAQVDVIQDLAGLDRIVRAVTPLNTG